MSTQTGSRNLALLVIFIQEQLTVKVTKELMGEVGQSVKNPVVKTGVFAIKYLYIKGGEGGRSSAGHKAEQWAVKSDVWPRWRKCKSSCQCSNIPWHLGLLPLGGAHARAGGTAAGSIGLPRGSRVRGCAWSLPGSPKILATSTGKGFFLSDVEEEGYLQGFAFGKRGWAVPGPISCWDWIGNHRRVGTSRSRREG